MGTEKKRKRKELVNTSHKSAFSQLDWPQLADDFRIYSNRAKSSGQTGAGERIPLFRVAVCPFDRPFEFTA